MYSSHKANDIHSVDNDIVVIFILNVFKIEFELCIVCIHELIILPDGI